MLNISVTNARSLRPKIESVIESFEELNTTIMTVSETWLTRDPLSERALSELENGHGIGCIRRDRPSKTSRNPGGGVAILFRKSLITLKELRFKRSGFEIVAATGKLRNSKNTVVVISTYFPPSLSKDRTELQLGCIMDCIETAKIRFTNPLVCVGGDFNRVDPSAALCAAPDMKMIDPIPTRGNAALEVAIVNFARDLVHKSANTALYNELGTESDHSVLHMEFKMRHVHSFKKIEYKTRIITDDAKEKFLRFFTYIDWEKLLGNVTCPSKATELLHEKIDSLNDMCFPWKLRKIRSTDKPWITDKIKRKIRSRKRCFKKYRRGPKWQEKKQITDKEIEKSIKEYFIKEIDKLKGRANVPFKALGHVTSPENDSDWHIGQLCP